jgi:pyruvate,orthophosphate dikinase
MTDTDAQAFLWLGPDGPEVAAELAGSKAAGLSRMARLGLPVPLAFALPTTLCAGVNAEPDRAAELVEPALRAGLRHLEAATGLGLGDPRVPLLVSVRSGAKESMPGMLSTVLDVGLTLEAVQGLIRRTGDPRLAWDSRRRFLETWATVVCGASPAPFARKLADIVRAEAAKDESELDNDALERLSAEFLNLASAARAAPPTAPVDQLVEAAVAVYRSWETPKAREYRRLNRLEDLAGTAVVVQAMVFGNSGRRSGAGVAFSRDPATGAKGLYLDFLFDAQGEDVVSGRRTPLGAERLGSRLPDVLSALGEGAAKLEAEYRDAQDVEFTIEDGRLWFLQTRTAKRTPRAALRTAVDLVREGVIDEATGLARVGGIDPDAASTTRFDEPAPAAAEGVAASPGVASGRIAFDSAHAKALAAEGPVILVRREPATEDIEGLSVADGILTAVGGRTAHAAVVARHMGKPCVVGCSGLELDEAGGRARVGDQALEQGDWISLNGDTGEVSLGRRTLVAERPEAELAEIARWKRRAEPVGAQSLAHR